jgi:hypothetical protein
VTTGAAARGRAARVAALVVGVLVLAAVGVAVATWLGGRPGDDPRTGIEADSARFTYGDRSVEVDLASCGREGDVVIMAGRSDGVVLQVAADLGEGGAARTGVTADLGTAGTLGAFGAALDQGPAGEVASVDTVGDALVVEGEWAGLDPDTFAVLPSPAPVAGRLVARCPASDPA